MQEKRKKFWIIFSIVIAAILSFSFIFGMITNLKTVNVEFKQRLAVGSRLNDDILEKVKKDGNFEYGKGLLFVDVNKSIDSIEKHNPFVKVHQVVAKFPNSLTVSIIEREPCFYSKTEGYYLIFDKEFKVLDKFEATSQGDEKLRNEYLKIVSEIDFDFSGKNLTAGDFVEQDLDLNVYKNVYLGVVGALESMSIVKSIRVEDDGLKILLKQDFINFDDGVVIELDGFDDIKIKTWVAVEYYEILDQETPIKSIFVIKDNSSANGYYANHENK